MLKTDIQTLIDHCYLMAEHLLVEQNGEFYPFGASISSSGEQKNAGHYDGDEFPLSEVIIRELRTNFAKELQLATIRAYAIAYDCLAKKNAASQKTDAIAIECVSNQEPEITTFYLPYQRISTDRFEFGELWSQTSG